MVDKNRLFRDANEYYQQGKWDKAIEIYKKILKIDPDNLNVFNMMGDIFLNKNEPEKAFGEYNKTAIAFENQGLLNKAIAINKKILRVKPDDVNVYLKLANLYTQLGLIGEANEHFLKVADIYSKQKDINKLLEIYKKIVDINPKNLNIKLRLIKMYLNENMNDQAADEYIKIAEKFKSENAFDNAINLLENAKYELPEYLKINSLLGELYSIKGNIDKALIEIQKVLSKDPKNKNAFNELSKIYRNTNKIDALINLYENFIKNQPADLEIKKELAKLYLQNSIFDKAESTLNELIKDENTNIDLHNQFIEVLTKQNKKNDLNDEYNKLGKLYLQNGQIDDADKFFQIILRNDPENTECFKQLIAISETQKNREKTIEYFLRLVQIEEKTGKKEDAIISYKKLIEFGYNRIDILNNMASIYHDLKKYDEAIEIFQLILNKKEDDVSTLKKLGEIFFENKNYEKSQDIYNKLLTFENSNKIHERLAEIFLRQNKHNEAIKEFQNILESDPGNIEIRSRLSELETKYSSTDDDRKVSILGYLDEAKIRLSRKQIGQAIELYKKVLKIDFDNEEANFALKEIAPDKYNKILDEVSNKIPDEPVKPKTTVKKPLFLDEAEEESLEDIIEGFKSGITEDIEEEDFESHYNLGIAYKETGLLDEAIEEFKIAANKEENKIQCYGILGICYMEKGVYDTAIKYFFQAMKLPKFDEVSYRWVKYDLALSYKKNGEREKALEFFKEVAKIDTDYRDVRTEIDELKKKIENNSNVPKNKISYI